MPNYLSMDGFHYENGITGKPVWVPKIINRRLEYDDIDPGGYGQPVTPELRRCAQRCRAA